jgi:hypothetical protein
MQAQAGRRRPKRWTATDQGMLVLVKLILADDWSAADAAAQLARRVRNPHVLAQMTARVRAAQSERPSELGERAARTLSHARARARAA